METTDLSMAIDKEAAFDRDELFFSITDTKGTILSGNNVFVRISGYTKEELIGKPHSIIRHPDMPRIIFKMLWDYLHANKPIVAYVKNKTKQGGYYWVLAAVFPLGDHYISIRIKPHTKLFVAAQELYRTLRMAETTNGMEESAKILLVWLEKLGYGNYNHFMVDLLLQELQERKVTISSCLRENGSQSLSPLFSKFKITHGYSTALMREYDIWFEKMDRFNHVKLSLEEKSLLLRHVAREIVFLSLNASVSSYKVETGGETFGVLARDVRNNAKENDSLISQIDTIVREVSTSLDEIVFAVAGMRLKIEMVIRFIEEVMCQEDLFITEVRQNMCDLIALVVEQSDKSKGVQQKLNGQIGEVLHYLGQLEQQMLYLGYVQIYGIIEAAASRHETVSFEGIFSQLKTLIESASTEIAAMQKMTERFRGENKFLMDKTEGIDRLLNYLREEIILIKNQEE